MAASETVRLWLQFDYPPPITPHFTVFWLLVDLNRCRVVTDLISLIRQPFSFSSGSVRLVRDNDCLRVKLEKREIPETSLAVSNGDDIHLPRKAKKWAFKLEEDEETELSYRYSKKQWKRQDNNSIHERVLDLEPKAIADQTGKKKGKRKNKATGGTVDEEEEETRRKSPKKKEKCEHKKQTKNSKCPKAQTSKEGTTQKSSSQKGSAKNSLVKARRKGGGGTCSKDSPNSSSESESGSGHDSNSDGISNVTLEVRNSAEKLSTEVSKEEPSKKNTAANKLVAKAAITTSKGKITRASSSSSDSTSDSEDQCMVSKSLFSGRGCPGPGLAVQTPSAIGWKFVDSNTNKQAPGPPPSVSLSTSLGRGWGRGEDLLSWKGKQQQLSEIVTNSSTIIQNPVEIHKKDYNLLPLLAAAPQVREKIAFKLLELTSDYSPDVSDYKEGKILSHNPETQQVDIEILSSLPALKEPGKFDLVYHNENGTEVVEYAVTQERRITVFWRELIDPRLILESPSTTSSTEHVRV
uniref:Coilin n=1 Tax=Sciurus vulgaris TaxID=55149 RepID=A0A8D2ATU1_SCIVU